MFFHHRFVDKLFVLVTKRDRDGMTVLLVEQNVKKALAADAGPKS